MSDLKQSSVALLEKAIDDKIARAQSRQGSTLATVTRVDNDGTTWVHVYGGADETPVRRMTSAASVGDVINVTFSGLSCMGVGNVTSPSATTKQVQRLSNESAQAIKSVMDGLLQVNTVVAQKVSTKDLDAEMATILTAAIDNATINALNAKYATIASVEAGYAKIDAANINTAAIRDAWVDNLLVQTGLLANDGTVFTLDAVEVDAANITTGTLDVRRLIITRTEGGVDQKYLVEIDPTTSQPTYVKMDGDVLGPHTVSADKLVAHSITASEITTQNLQGTNGWINLASGTFSYGNPSTGQGITWDGSTLNIQGSVHVGGSTKTLSQIASDSETAKDICTISITSTNGTVFKTDSGVSTTLNVRIFTGDGQVIETATALRARYGNSAYLQWMWKDSGANDYTTLLSNDSRISRDGFSLTVTPADISTQAVINCELIY